MLWTAKEKGERSTWQRKRYETRQRKRRKNCNKEEHKHMQKRKTRSCMPARTYTHKPNTKPHTHTYTDAHTQLHTHLTTHPHIHLYTTSSADLEDGECRQFWDGIKEFVNIQNQPKISYAFFINNFSSNCYILITHSTIFTLILKYAPRRKQTNINYQITLYRFSRPA